MDVGMAHLDGAFGAHDDRLARQFALEAGDQGGDPSSAVHHRGRGICINALWRTSDIRLRANRRLIAKAKNDAWEGTLT